MAKNEHSNALHNYPQAGLVTSQNRKQADPERRKSRRNMQILWLNGCWDLPTSLVSLEALMIASKWRETGKETFCTHPTKWHPNPNTMSFVNYASTRRRTLTQSQHCNYFWLTCGGGELDYSKEVILQKHKPLDNHLRDLRQNGHEYGSLYTIPATFYYHMPICLCANRSQMPER